MRAITLWQPWASLIAEGVKTIETRSWKAPDSLIGERIAIHAAARKPPKCEPCNGSGCGPGTASGAFEACDWCGGTGVHGLCAEVSGMPLGAVVATARLAACVPMVDLGDPYPDPCVWIWPEDSTGETTAGYDHRGWENSESVDITDQLPYGDFRPGRWAWLLDDVEKLPEPIPATGRQRVWRWEP